MGIRKPVLFFLFFLTLQLCGLVSNVFGQEGNLLFHHLTLEDGLSELTNEFVFKDSRGFIWISSINGLNRFDGVRVSRYLPDPNDSTAIYGENVQSNFYEDAASNLWFSTFFGINCYDRKHDNFYHNFIRQSTGREIEGYDVFDLDTLHRLWLIVGDTSMYTFNISTRKFELKTILKYPRQRACSMVDRSSNLHRIFAYKINQVGIEEVDFDMSGNEVNHHIIGGDKDNPVIRPYKLVAEGDSVLWISVINELIRYNIHTQTIRQLPIENLLTIETLNDSILLVSLDQQGVYELNKKTFALGYHYLPENDNSLSLLTNRIAYMSRDCDNGFWMCSQGFGISYAYLGKRKFNLYNPFTVRDAENKKFSPNGFILDSSNHVFCSTEIGGTFLLDRDCRIIKEINGRDEHINKKHKKVYSILKDTRDHIWLSSYSGLASINNSYKNIFNVASNNILLDGLELADGRVIFTSVTGGLFEVTETSNEYAVHQILQDSFKLTYTPLQQDKTGRIWMSEEMGKYIIAEPGTFKVIRELPIKGLCTPYVESPDGKIIWIASSNGLYEVDFKNPDICKFYNEENGFPSVGLNSMLMDDHGLLWITSKIGVIVFNPETESSKVYNYEDGLPSTNFNRFGAIRFDDGEMWFGSPRGIVKFRPDELHDLETQAVPQITELFVNDEHPSKILIDENSQNTNITEIDRLRFTYKQNTLTFIVNSLEYSAPRRNKVKYKLDGIDSKWIETSSGSRVRYPNLPAGTFTFNVLAANSDGVYNPLIRKLEIIIIPPFYKTWWFILLVSIATLGLIVYIVYLNFSKTIEVQKMRLRLYENLHDDVGSRLTAIVFASEDLISSDNNPNPKMQHISIISKSIVGNMRRLVWAMDPENDSMESLVQKIRYDKSLILDEKINCHLELDEHLKKKIIPGEIRYQLTSVIHEAMNNISKYARAKNVWIEFRQKEKYLSLLIKDDGIGFNIDEVCKDKIRTSGYGLANMQKRVSRVKGQIAIQSNPGDGTIIEVSIPFK